MTIDLLDTGEDFTNGSNGGPNNTAGNGGTAGAHRAECEGEGVSEKWSAYIERLVEDRDDHPASITDHTQTSTATTASVTAIQMKRVMLPR